MLECLCEDRANGVRRSDGTHGRARVKGIEWGYLQYQRVHL